MNQYSPEPHELNKLIGGMPLEVYCEWVKAGRPGGASAEKLKEWLGAYQAAAGKV